MAVIEERATTRRLVTVKIFDLEGKDEDLRRTFEYRIPTGFSNRDLLERMCTAAAEALKDTDGVDVELERILSKISKLEER